MNFELSEEHLAVKEAARDFAQNVLKPGVIQRDNDQQFPKEEIKQLAELGFNFHYFTNIYTTKKGLQYIFCYDMGYREIENNEYLLVHKQEYVS